MWELYTGERLFDEKTSIGQVFYMIVHEGWRPPIPKGCPPGYVELMAACWAEDPKQRPRANEVLNTLQELYMGVRQHRAQRDKQHRDHQQEQQQQQREGQREKETQQNDQQQQGKREGQREDQQQRQQQRKDQQKKQEQREVQLGQRDGHREWHRPRERNEEQEQKVGSMGASAASDYASAYSEGVATSAVDAGRQGPALKSSDDWKLTAVGGQLGSYRKMYEQEPQGREEQGAVVGQEQGDDQGAVVGQEQREEQGVVAGPRQWEEGNLKGEQDIFAGVAKGKDSDSSWSFISRGAGARRAQHDQTPAAGGSKDPAAVLTPISEQADSSADLAGPIAAAGGCDHASVTISSPGGSEMGYSAFAAYSQVPLPFRSHSKGPGKGVAEPSLQQHYSGNTPTGPGPSTGCSFLGEVRGATSGASRDGGTGVTQVTSAGDSRSVAVDEPVQSGVTVTDSMLLPSSSSSFSHSTGYMVAVNSWGSSGRGGEATASRAGAGGGGGAGAGGGTIRAPTN